MKDKFVTDISNMSTPGQIAMVIALIKIMDIQFSRYKSVEKKTSQIIKFASYTCIYIFILNWLCSNNMCWASWVIVISQLVYSLITMILIFSIINFASSMNYRYKQYNNQIDASIF